MVSPRPTRPLFPYTTLFRSRGHAVGVLVDLGAEFVEGPGRAHRGEGHHPDADHRGAQPLRMLDVVVEVFGVGQIAAAGWGGGLRGDLGVLDAQSIAGGRHGLLVLLGHRDLGGHDDPEAGLLHAGEDLGDALFGDMVLEHHELDADSCNGNLLWLSRAASPGAAQRAAGHVAITVASGLVHSWVLPVVTRMTGGHDSVITVVVRGPLRHPAGVQQAHSPVPRRAEAAGADALGLGKGRRRPVPTAWTTRAAASRLPERGPIFSPAPRSAP